MKKNAKNRLLSLVMSFAVAGTVTAAIIPDADYDVSAASLMTADQIMKNMGLGWNLGNSLDANTSGAYFSDITQYETQWGNPVVTQDLIDAVKKKGFNTVRIPVTWYQHITVGADSNGNKTYSIDKKWLARVKQVVDYAYNNGMYVIINVHHEPWVNRSDLGTAYSQMSPELKQVWYQIADYFKEYDQHLIFEGMNEPRAVGTDHEFYGNVSQSEFNTINKLNRDFLETVRSVESDYQYSRVLMIPDYAASCDSSWYSQLVIPKAKDYTAYAYDKNSDGVDDFLAVSIHAYSPYNFTMNPGTSHSSFTNAYKAELTSIFNGIRSTFIANDIPVIIGEFSASNYNNNSARNDWAQAYLTITKQMGVPCVLWDNNADSNGDSSEAHGYINRSNNTWYSSSVSVVDTMLSVLNDSSIPWKASSSLPMYAHEQMSSSVSTSDGDVSSLCSSVLQKGRELAVKYDSVEPRIAIGSGDTWAGWTLVAPSDMDPIKKIAYFSYETIMESWDPSIGTINHIKVTNSNHQGISSSAVGVINFSGTPASSSSSVSTSTGSLISTGFVPGEIVVPTPGTDPDPDPDPLQKGEVVFYDTPVYIEDNATESIVLTSDHLRSDRDIIMTLSGEGSEINPRAGFMNSTWGGWTEVNPYKRDGDKYYFSYSDIISKWNSANGSIANICAIGHGYTLEKFSSVSTSVSSEDDGVITVEKIKTMDIRDVIAYVNTFMDDVSKDTFEMDEVQLAAVRRVLEYNK